MLSSNPQHLAFYLFCLLFLRTQCVSALSRNFTVDDQRGDERTRRVPTYTPPSMWGNQDCVGCAIKPDVNTVFDRTYTAATFQPERGFPFYSVGFDFEGTAIYVFFTLCNNEGQGVTVNTECNFTIDGQHVGFLNHTGDPSKQGERSYQALVFNKTDLPLGPHYINISMSDVDYHVYLNFDYAIYTNQVNDMSSSPPSTNAAMATADRPVSPGIIVGAVIGGLAVLTGFAVLLYFCCRDRRNHDRAPKSPPATIPRPFILTPQASRIQSTMSVPVSPEQAGASRSSQVVTIEQGSSSRNPSMDISSPTTRISRSAENKLHVANRRMRDLQAELASNSSGNRSRVTRELMEEVKRLRTEIQELKQRQREQQQQQTVNALNAPPPTYTDFQL